MSYLNTKKQARIHKYIRQLRTQRCTKDNVVGKEDKISLYIFT